MAVASPTIILIPHQEVVAVAYTVKEEYVDDDGYRQRRPTEIPDGLWVAQTSSTIWEEEHWDLDDRGDYSRESESRSFEVVGPAPEQSILMGSHHQAQSYSNGRTASSSSTHVLVGERPFGVVRSVEVDCRPIGGLWFDCARQVHKGQLGPRPQIARPRFARETYRHHAERPMNWADEPIRPRDARRGKVGWCRLSELASLVNMSAEEVVLRYFRFTDMEQPQLHVIMAADRDQIHGQLITPDRRENFKAVDLPTLFQRPLEQVWIRQGFAMAVLYLRRFGYMPEPIQIPQTV